jgi:hypothetical protein
MATGHRSLGRHRNRRPPLGALVGPAPEGAHRLHQTVSGSEAIIALPGLQLKACEKWGVSLIGVSTRPVDASRCAAG